jgi:hypothetical protein
MENIQKLIDSAVNKGYEPFNPYWDYENHGSPDINYLELCLIQKYIREVYTLHIDVNHFLRNNDVVCWDYSISALGTETDERGNWAPIEDFDLERDFDTYEEALQGGIETALNLI